jgi:5-hydroxyisourate hydrolase-like protein (transthyretin family)
MRAILILCLILLSNFADSQSLESVLIDRNDQPIPFANIDVFVGNELIWSSLTDRKGKFEIPNTNTKALLAIHHYAFQPRKFELEDTIKKLPSQIQLFDKHLNDAKELTASDSLKKGIGALQGDVLAISSGEPVPFVKVVCYKNGGVVIGAQTDFEGKFNIPKLNSGYYKIAFYHVDFQTLVFENVKVTPERITFLNRTELIPKSEDLKELEEVMVKSYKAPMIMTDGSAAGRTITREDIAKMPARDGVRVMSSVGGISSESTAISTGSAPASIGDKMHYHSESVQNAKPGVLTAGEINDFSKWEMWKDLTTAELKAHHKNWQLAVSGRYSVQVLNENGGAVINARVVLRNEVDKELFTARTDNTGKAELWGSLKPSLAIQKPTSIAVYYENEYHLIKRPIPFEQGINSVKLAVACNEPNKVEIAFVVDATGSMGDEINFLKAELNDVIYQVKNSHPTLHFRYANLFYRDHGDAYLTKSMPFTTSLSETVAYISEQTAAGGGDYEEAVEIALDSTIHHLNWSADARTRIIFLVLDAPPHNNPQIQAALENSMRSAAEKGIRIVPLVASGINKSGEYLMRTLALATNGTYAFLTNHSGVGNDHIEPSTDSYKVELLNDLMVRIMNNFIYLPNCEEVPQIEEEITELNSPDLVKPSWKVWPNPTDGIVNILVEEEVEELFLMDLTGKILQRITKVKPNRTIQLDLSNYAAGIYLISEPNGQQWISKKVVLVK